MSSGVVDIARNQLAVCVKFDTVRLDVKWFSNDLINLYGQQRLVLVWVGNVHLMELTWIFLSKFNIHTVVWKTSIQVGNRP